MAFWNAAKKIEAPTHPHRAALVAHLQRIDALSQKRQSVAARDAQARRDREAGEAAAARVAALSAAVDQAQADLRYGSGDSTDLPQLREQLADAERESARLAGFARSAAIAQAGYASQLTELSHEQQALARQTPRQLHPAIVESMFDDLDEYRDLAGRIRFVARRIFSKALAADKVAMDNGLGIFTGSARYRDLNIPEPTVFEPEYANDIEKGKALEAAQAARHEDAQQLERDADAVIHSLLMSATD